MSCLGPQADKQADWLSETHTHFKRNKQPHWLCEADQGDGRLQAMLRNPSANPVEADLCRTHLPMIYGRYCVVTSLTGQRSRERKRLTVLLQRPWKKNCFQTNIGSVLRKAWGGRGVVVVVCLCVLGGGGGVRVPCHLELKLGSKRTLLP